MPKFTFEGPDGRRHTIEGPEGATPEQAFQILQQSLAPGLLKSAASGLIEGAGAPGDVSNRVLGNAPPQQPVDKETYYGKLVDALNTARKHLELPTTQQIGGAVGMQPTQPVTVPEKLVQATASAIPGMAMTGSPAGRAAMGAIPTQRAIGNAAAGVRGLNLSPQGPTAPVGGPPQAAPQGAGQAAQQGYLQQAAQEIQQGLKNPIAGPMMKGAASAALKHAGNFLPFPMNYAAQFAPKVLGFE